MAFESALADADDAHKDRALRDDIRLLGRILGDTVREQKGEETYALVEQIRQASMRHCQTKLNTAIWRSGAR